MKKIQKLTLNRLQKNELTNPEMNKVKGGNHSCFCGCCYGGEPGSIDNSGYPSYENAQANCDDYKYSNPVCIHTIGFCPD